MLDWSLSVQVQINSTPGTIKYNTIYTGYEKNTQKYLGVWLGEFKYIFRTRSKLFYT